MGGSFVGGGKKSYLSKKNAVHISSLGVRERNEGTTRKESFLKGSSSRGIGLIGFSSEKAGGRFSRFLLRSAEGCGVFLSGLSPTLPRNWGLGSRILSAQRAV